MRIEDVGTVSNKLKKLARVDQLLGDIHKQGPSVSFKVEFARRNPTGSLTELYSINGDEAITMMDRHLLKEREALIEELGTFGVVVDPETGTKDIS